MHATLRLSLGIFLLASANALAQKPLPNVADLQGRAVVSYDRSVELRQKYICKERVESREYNGKGRLKQTDITERELFYVNRTAIAQANSRNGKPLSADELRKRDQNVRKAIEEASKVKPQSNNGGSNFSIRDVLKYGKLDNERRTEVAGRPTIVFEIVQDPDKGGSVEQKIIHAMEGSVAIDEATGIAQDINAEGKRDVKIGGGLLANIHKGFHLHVQLAPQEEGVWLIKLFEGKGDARVGLFMNKADDFRNETLSCQAYDVTTTQSGDKLHQAPKP